MGVCVCGRTIDLAPRACRIADRALLWPPVRVNADGTEHACARPARPRLRLVGPPPTAAERAVTRLAGALAAEHEARAAYYGARAGAGQPVAHRPSTAGPGLPPAASAGGAVQPPAPTGTGPDGLPKGAISW